MNIVVGYTPTPEGLAAVDYAVDVATDKSATVHVVNSGDRGNDSGPSFAAADDWDALQSRLTGQGLEVEMHQVELALSAADEILKVAESTSAELIVIGLRKRSPVGKLFLGSVSQQVILDADCPVVAVKRKG